MMMSHAALKTGGLQGNRFMIVEKEPTVGARARTDRRFVSQLTRNTFAMVLEGERASSLHELTDWRSKPAVAFGGKFRIIDFACPIVLTRVCVALVSPLSTGHRA
jgi:hypothetical protein